MTIRFRKRAFFAALAILGLVAYGLWFSLCRVDLSPHISTDNNLTTFSSEHIEASRGRVVVDIPEVYELMHIAIAVADSDSDSWYYIHKRGDYYDVVIERFSPFRSHELVSMLQETLDGSIFHRAIFAYRFEGDSIVHGGEYRMSWLDERLVEYPPLLEDFAMASGFRDFFASSSDYYSSQVDDYHSKVPVAHMWSWLEQQFPQRYDSLRVVMSPLTGSTNNTWRFRDRENNYEEAVMFVSGPDAFISPDLPEAVNEAMMARMVFTELDHNYVNPTTDLRRNLRRIVRVFSDTERWHTGPGYQGPALIFNEYMTWAVFTLYARDTYDESTFEIVDALTVDTMNRRGFIRYEDFSDVLMELYENRREGETVADLYPEILRWAETHVIREMG